MVTMVNITPAKPKHVNKVQSTAVPKCVFREPLAWL